MAEPTVLSLYLNGDSGLEQLEAALLQLATVDDELLIALLDEESCADADIHLEVADVDDPESAGRDLLWKVGQSDELCIKHGKVLQDWFRDEFWTHKNISAARSRASQDRGHLKPETISFSFADQLVCDVMAEVSLLNCRAECAKRLERVDVLEAFQTAAEAVSIRNAIIHGTETLPFKAWDMPPSGQYLAHCNRGVLLFTLIKQLVAICTAYETHEVSLDKFVKDVRNEQSVVVIEYELSSDKPLMLFPSQSDFGFLRLVPAESVRVLDDFQREIGAVQEGGKRLVLPRYLP
ncbi:hypothetical protein ACFL2H_07025 [Planctomycetota bacterium]